MILRVEMDSEVAEEGAGVKRARKIPGARWESMRPIIQKLYPSMPLASLMLIMCKDHQFAATAKQYKRRFAQWGLVKNVRGRVKERQRLNTLRNFVNLEPAPTEIQQPHQDQTDRRFEANIHFTQDQIAAPEPQIERLHAVDNTAVRQAAECDHVHCTTQLQSADANRPKQQPLLPRHLFIGSHLTSRWSVIHRALLLGIIRGKLIPCLYKYNPHLGHHSTSADEFSLMRIHEAILYIGQRGCQLEELLLASYLITHHPMTPMSDTSDITWSKVSFLAVGKACSVLTRFESTVFRDRQVAEYEAAKMSARLQDDAWSTQYVSTLTDLPLNDYDISHWEPELFATIDNLMHHVWCSPEWQFTTRQDERQGAPVVTKDAIVARLEAGAEEDDEYYDDNVDVDDVDDVSDDENNDSDYDYRSIDIRMTTEERTGTPELVEV